MRLARGRLSRSWLALSSRLSLLDHHFHLPAWTQGQVVPWIRRDRLSWHQPKVDALRQSRDEQVSFHQRQVIADANAWPGSKGKIGVAGKLLFALGCEAFRIEGLWVRKVCCCAVQNVGRYQDSGSPGSLPDTFKMRREHRRKQGAKERERTPKEGPEEQPKRKGTRPFKQE